MTDQGPTRWRKPVLLEVGLSMALLWLAGCTGAGPGEPQDRAWAILPASEAQVRAAILHVLSADGYVVDVQDRTPLTVQTGYRQEIRGPWDWLLTHGVGTGRSWVEAVLETEEAGTTRVTVHVWSEGKEGLFTSWKPDDPPLSQSAHEQLWKVRRVLSLR